jgi:hypothetical protein
VGAPVFRAAPTISQMHNTPHLTALNQRLRTQCATRGTRVLSFAEGLPTPLVEVRLEHTPLALRADLVTSAPTCSLSTWFLPLGVES